MFIKVDLHLRYQLTIIFCGHSVNIPVNFFLRFSNSLFWEEEMKGEKRTEVLARFKLRFKVDKIATFKFY